MCERHYAYAYFMKRKIHFIVLELVLALMLISLCEPGFSVCTHLPTTPNCVALDMTTVYGIDSGATNMKFSCSRMSHYLCNFVIFWSIWTLNWLDAASKLHKNRAAHCTAAWVALLSIRIRPCGRVAITANQTWMHTVEKNNRAKRIRQIHKKKSQKYSSKKKTINNYITISLLHDYLLKAIRLELNSR